MLPGGFLRPGAGHHPPARKHRRPRILVRLLVRLGERCFLKGYLDVAAQNPMLPPNENHVRLLLDTFLIERALEEAARELNQRPEWARVPLRTLARVLERPFRS